MRDDGLLDDGDVLLLRPKLAAKIGLNEALVLQQLHYWLQRSPNELDGRRWVWNTVGAWCKEFPFWSEATIKRTFASLREAGLVEKTTNPAVTGPRTAWYTIDYEVLAKASGHSDPTTVQDEPMNGAERPDASGQSDPQTKTTPETSQETPPTGEERAPASEPFALTLVTNDATWEPRVKKVGTKKVTPDEDRKATTILECFNDVFGKHFTATDYLVRIIGRLREHPEVTLEQHRQLIERQFDSAWWKSSPPTPNLIYGSGGQYEKCLYDDGKHTRPTNERERMMERINGLADGTFGA